jgi:glycine dehydrogenase subunit 1
MAVGATRRGKVVVSATSSPQLREVLRTYLEALDVELVEASADGGLTAVSELDRLSEGAAAVIVQHPNFFGLLEPIGEITRVAHAAGGLSVASVDPISLAVLKPPGDRGVDVAVGEGQSLGSPPGFGGPLLGFMAVGRKHLRRLPGRVIGATSDAQGRRGYVMTLQTREQHIRREKATSNICTNQGLVALGAAVYLSLLGEIGLAEVARHVVAKAHYAADALSRIEGVRLRFDGAFFREFVVELPIPAHRVKEDLGTAGIWPGIACGCYYDDMENCLLVSVTERHRRDDIDSLASALSAIVAPGRAS